MKLVVFAYNFPHRKSHDFIVELVARGHKVDAIVAADAVKLNIPPSTVRTKVRRAPGPHPKDTARILGLEYINLPHQGEAIEGLLDDLKPDIGVIGGARILKKPVIDRFSVGIINFHPGLIPEARGLDALLWSVHFDQKLGVTSHLIDERVDAGSILERQEIEIEGGDTVFDLSERLYDTQLAMLDSSVKNAISRRWSTLDYGSTTYNRKMPADLEVETLSKIEDYVRRYSCE